jgi:hypothetical protein
MDILKSLNQDFNAIKKIEDSLFDVVNSITPNLPDFESPSLLREAEVSR